MAFDGASFGAGKGYTNLVAIGLTDVTVDNVNKSITFTTNDGETQTLTFNQPTDGKDGKDGNEMVDFEIVNNHIVAVMSDGTRITSEQTLPTTESVSPTATVSKVGKVSTLTVTDVNGTTSVEINDGADGQGGGSANLTEALTINNTIGDCKAGTTLPKGTSLESIIRNMLYIYKKPTIAVSITPNTTLYDAVTGSISTIKLKGVVTKGTNDLVSVTFKVNNTVVNTVTTAVKDGGTFEYQYTPETPITSTSTFRVECADDKSTVGETITTTFIGRSYYGTIADSVGKTITEQIVKTLSTTLKNSKAFTYSGISVEYGRVLYAYPKSLGAVTKIVDADNRDYTASYESGTVTVDNIEYYYYLLKDSMGTTSGYQKFS